MLISVMCDDNGTASGKSNILAAMLWVSDAVRTSLRSWDEEIPVEPFLFGDAKDSDSSFVIEMTVSGVRFDYYLDIGDIGSALRRSITILLADGGNCSNAKAMN